MQATRMLFLHALSPLHPGTGQSVNDIDLPIAREKATSLPYLPGSSVKGVLREACADDARCDILFGPKPSSESGATELYAGMLQFADLRLLLMPIRSLRGTFAWVTSPYVLQRFSREAQAANLPVPEAVPNVAADQCTLTHASALTLKKDHQTSVYLEDLLLKVAAPSLDDWADCLGEHCFKQAAWHRFLHQRLCLVHDEVFAFLLQTATEITARIRLQSDAKTVEQGGLWYEEALPAETILSGLVLATPLAKHNGCSAAAGFATLSEHSSTLLQFGGNATIGRGLCNVTLAGGA